MSYSGHVYARYTDEEELLIFLLTELEPLDQDRGYLGIGGFEKPQAENRLRGFQDEGLIKIDGRMYRLTAPGEQRCQMIPRREA